ESVTPSGGQANGGELVRLIGTGFGPRVAVRFGDSRAEVVTLREEGGASIADVRTPSHDEGAVDVAVQNLTTDGAEVAGELTTLESAYRFVRARLAEESDLTRLVRTLLRTLKRDISANTSMRVHVDYADERHVDGMRVVPLAQLPALMLSGPDLPENRTYSTNEAHEEVVAGPGGPEIVRYGPPMTVDLEFRLTGSSDHTVELLNLMAAVGRFLNRTMWIEMERDPERPELGSVRWELRPAGPFRTRLDGPDGLKAFASDLVVRGYDLDEGGPTAVGATTKESELTAGRLRLLP
ncbi:MAG TPA: IPT/TIG domain-containing protein, partial [Sandaracinaceae bacterium LLY-WYZ-13_1]|nr:IPT/TIG domain-containing protein [Sandaracinaceae bacterium LLY-WYZ-13_1]